MRSFRKTALCAILAFAFVVCSAAPAGAITAGKLTLSDECFDCVLYTNLVRRDAGRQPLTIIPALQSVADLRAKEALDCAPHVRPDGSSYKTAYPASLTRRRDGENTAYEYGGPRGPEQNVESLSNSPGHYKNMTDGDFTHIAVGFARDTEGGYLGVYNQNFLSANCRHSSLAIVKAPSKATLGDTIESMRVLARLNCSVHGESYLPVSGDMITGYDPELEDVEQTVTVSAMGMKTSFKVTLREKLPDRGVLYYGYNDIIDHISYAKNCHKLVEGTEDVICVYPRIYTGTLIEREFKGATVKDKDGGDVGSKAKVASGMTLKTKDGKKYTLSVKGDADGDSLITAADARLALRFALELDKPLPWQRLASMALGYGDYENDITAENARTILRGALGLTDPADWLIPRSEGYFTLNYYIEDGKTFIIPYPPDDWDENKDYSDNWNKLLSDYFTYRHHPYYNWVQHLAYFDDQLLTFVIAVDPRYTDEQKKRVEDYIREHVPEEQEYIVEWP